MARLTVWIIPMKRSVHVNHSRWPVLMECALISFGFAMGQTIAGISQTNRTATYQQLHQVKKCVIYVVMFFPFLLLFVCSFFFSCLMCWYQLRRLIHNRNNKRKHPHKQKKNKNKNKLHSVWKLHSGKEILEYCKTWTRYQEQNEW